MFHSYFTFSNKTFIINLVINLETEEKIKKILNSIRPFLQADGGDLEFVNFEEGIVYVKLTGACEHCHASDYTIKNTVEEILLSEIPEVKEVINAS